MKKLYYIAFGMVPFAVGLNIYFATWYLGSSGDTMNWSFDLLTFPVHILVANSSSLMTSMLLSWLSRSVILPPGAYGMRKSQTKFLFVWAGSMMLFALLYGVLLSIYLYLQYPFTDAVNMSISYISSYNFLSLLVYYFTLGLVVLAFLNLWRRVGSFSKLFHHLMDSSSGPVQEKRGFVFIDLNHSTAIAENLGPEQYSRLIRECFRLLDQLLKSTMDLEVYQYVGDEAVLSWKLNKKTGVDQAINLFVNFKKQIREQAPYFRKEYGCVPQFKCGIHGGLVIRTEIGQSSMHMAYHGDAVNATSRILSLCHSYGTDLLVSEKIFEAMGPTPSGYYSIPVKAVSLDGRRNRINLYSIQQSPMTRKSEQESIYNSILLSKNDYQSNLN